MSTKPIDRSPLPQGGAVLLQTEIAARVMGEMMARGGHLLMQTAGIASQTSVQICGARSKSRFISQLKAAGAEITERSTWDGDGERLSWEANISGARVQWFEYRRNGHESI